jgi:hypothetical protein
LAWLPGWAGALLVFGALAAVLVIAVRQTSSSTAAPDVEPTVSNDTDGHAPDDTLTPPSSTTPTHTLETTP